MATTPGSLDAYDADLVPDGAGMTVAVVTAEWNAPITGALREGALATLRRHGVREDRLHDVTVPGSFELPSAAQMLLEFREPDAVICLGCVIKGETRHDEYINQAVAQGLTQLSLQYGVPVVFGVLTTENEAQALDRAGGRHGNKGVEAAVTALRMAGLQARLSGGDGDGVPA
jgi:6,7-dimethyl-8-ribityllumazine synthase